MKNIKVRIIDSNTLEILEQAQEGDRILLTSIDTIDTSFVNKVIETEYRQCLEEEIRKAKQSFEVEKELALSNKEKEQSKKISELENQISTLKLLKEKDIALEKENTAKEYKEQIIRLESQKKELESAYQIKELQNENKYKEEYQQLKDDNNKRIKDLEDEIARLENTKSTMSVKSIGESLEAFCDTTIRELMENGLANCTWTKDNEIKKEADDKKGNKADFIFKIYTDENKSTLLSSICLDMKDEDPSSVNKKRNRDYFEQLEKNRRLKNCEYSLLVSTLESNLNLPMFKVKEYQNMYVVRPAYLTSFINLIVSLTNRYKELLLRKQKEEIDLVSKKEFIEEFNKLKETYLDKPLNQLKDKIESILAQCENIEKANENIKKTANAIISTYINDIQKKLDKFSVVDKKLEKVI